MNELEVIRTVKEGHYDEEFVYLACRDLYRLWHGLPPLDDGKSHYCCRATDRYRKNGETLYAAEIYSVVEQEDTSRSTVAEVLFDLPRDAFVFEDRLYSRE